jgi:putative protease
MSALIGRRSGNRGLCAGPCRLNYGFGGKAEGCYPLSLKDLTLASRLRELEEIGVQSVKIEGRMRRPEYAAVVTRVFSNAIKNGAQPADAEMEVLSEYPAVRE